MTKGATTWNYTYNADAYIATGQGLLGNNMFAYCGNPVMRIDESGQEWKWWVDSWSDVKTWVEERKEEAQGNVNITTSSGITGSAAFGAGASFSFGSKMDTKGNVGILLGVVEDELMNLMGR